MCGDCYDKEHMYGTSGHAMDLLGVVADRYAPRAFQTSQESGQVPYREAA